MRRSHGCAVKFFLWKSEICFACEMRACARVKWRFQRSTVSVSLRDGSKNSGFCRFLLPCFATGCRASGFQIATAALRPRNDTGSERVYLENRDFWVLYRVFSSRLSVFVPPFLQKTAVRTETRSHGGFGMRRALRERSLRRLRRMQPVCKNYSRLEKCLMVRTI